MSDQIENFREAIRKKKARILEINLALAESLRPGATAGSRRRLIEERLHLEKAVAELETTLRRLEFEDADRLFRWEDIDQELLKAKTFELSRKMHEVAVKGERRIQFETARNLNSSAYLAFYFDFHEQFANDWAEQLYAVHCETWKQQNRPLLPSFIRAVRDRALLVLFAARKSSVCGQVALRVQRTNEPPRPLAVAEWMRRMDRLADRWSRKLEGYAVAAKYAGMRDQPNETTSPADLAVADPERIAALTPTEALSVEEALLPIEQNGKDLVRREAIVKKVENPQAYKFFSVEEAAVYFDVRPRTIYRWQLEGKLRDGARRGAITIESARLWQDRRARKRRSK